MNRRQVDVVIAGSGPGGTTVGRALARAGRRVLVLERGRRHQMLGNHLAGLALSDGCGMRTTREGLNLVRGITLGGSTVLYCGTAARPPAWLRDRYHVDIDEQVAETVTELGLQPLPDECIGPAGLRLLEAGDALGFGFERLPKFIDPERCRSVCGGSCMLGCRHGAKWTARAYADDMVEAGGEVLTRASVTRVLHEDGVARGVEVRAPGGPVQVEAETVILAAGGLGTPEILRNSGIDEAGEELFIDPLQFVTGVSKHRGTSSGPPMAVGTYAYLDDGVLLSDLMDPWGLWLLMTARARPNRLPDIVAYRRMLGLMVKVADERGGRIGGDGTVSKPLTERDRGRLARGVDMAREVLRRAGCDPSSLVVGPVRGAHPGATAAIGRVVDTNLETRVKNLFVSDASVLPEALGRPVVLTLIGLAKRLAAHLLGRRSPPASQPPS